MKKIILAILVIIALAAGGLYWMKAGNPNALRHIVLDQCVPNQQQNRSPAPCAQVKTDAGYVVFKDRNGPLQYLLMPTYRINGTESPLSGTSEPRFMLIKLRDCHASQKKFGV